MREADLERHLSNPTDKDDDGQAKPKPAAPAQPRDQGADKGTEKKAEPVEMGSKGDYQLNQALNLLKGLQIISKK
jgi:carboxyl-terminal processing protease